MARKPVALLAGFYAGAVTLWVIGLLRGWTVLGTGEEVYVLVLALYASLSWAALRARPDDPRVRVFVASQAVSALTIVWPIMDLAQPDAALLWITTVGGAFIYALPLPLYIHLAAIIPDEHRLAGRWRWVVPAHYAAAAALALFTTLMYADQIRLAHGATTTLLPLRLDVEGAYALDTLMNAATYVYASFGALLLLVTAALRYPSVQARRQALIVCVGIAPWALYTVWALWSEVTGVPADPPAWDLALQAALILFEAVALFVAVAGYQLFDLGLVLRRGLIHGGAVAICAALLAIGLLGLGVGLRALLGVDLAAWHVVAALLAVSFAFHPLLQAVERGIDAVFFRQKLRLRRLHRTLIPSLARRTNLDGMAAYLTRRLRRTLGFRSAALLLPDEARDFYRVRALSGAFTFREQASGAVMRGDDLAQCWSGPLDAVLARGPTMWSERLGPGCRDLPVMLALLGADYLVPFRLGDELVAVLALGDRRAPYVFDRDDEAQLELLAQQASAMLENARLFHLARHDPLTGLPRRGVFEERFALELSRSVRDFEPITVAMVDIDDFKDVNDRFGHLVGDRALRAVADVMRSVSRVTDVVARYGGEEFVMLLPDTDERGAIVVATKLRDAIASERLALGPHVELLMTLSIGLVTVSREDVRHDVQEFVRRADHALYEAKLRGKNRFEVFGGRAGGAAAGDVSAEPSPS